jgi:hypothetical protein
VDGVRRLIVPRLSLTTFPSGRWVSKSPQAAPGLSVESVGWKSMDREGTYGMPGTAGMSFQEGRLNAAMVENSKTLCI